MGTTSLISSPGGAKANEPAFRQRTIIIKVHSSCIYIGYNSVCVCVYYCVCVCVLQCLCKQGRLEGISEYSAPGPGSVTRGPELCKK